MNILDVLVKTKQIISFAEGRRLISQKGVKVNGKVIEDSSVEVRAGCIMETDKRGPLYLTTEMLLED